uniref:Uncharacterized protein n=1 Tax=Panagrolaimus sp. PS1159 TaxID=55785 RepID=A0AC35FH10_9BILA
LFSKMFLFCLFIGVQFLFLDSASAEKFDSNNSGILDGNAREKSTLSSDVILLSDGTAKGTKYGERDVLLSGSGPINLTLTSSELEFEVCDCAGTSSVCYKSLDGWDTIAVGSCFHSKSSSVCYKSLDGWGNTIRAGSCSDSTSCELNVYDDDGAGIYFGKARVPKTKITGCLQTTMRYPDTEVKGNAKDLGIFESCSPKVVDDDIIELFIRIDRSCSIIVKNAKVNVPITPPSTNSTTNVPPEHSPEHPSEASFP